MNNPIVHKFINLDEMNQFLERHNTGKSHTRIHNLNRHIVIKEIE